MHISLKVPKWYILVPFTSPVCLYIFRLVYRLPACQQLLTARNRTDRSPTFIWVICFCLSQSQLDNECLHRQAQHARSFWNALGLYSSTASAGFQLSFVCLYYTKIMSEFKTCLCPCTKYNFAVFPEEKEGYTCELDHCRYSWRWRHWIFHRVMPLDRYCIFTFSVSFLQAQYLIFNQKL